MKKAIKILLVFIVLSNSVANAQYVVKGTNVVSAGIGIGSAIGTYTHSSQTPGFSIQYERGIWEIPGPGVISLGGYLGTKSFRNKQYGYTQNWNYTVIGVRGAYHYNDLKRFNNKFLDKLDVYGGVMVSFNILHYSDDFPAGSVYNHDYNSAPGASLFVGGRYFITNNFAVYSELGYGVSILNVGVSLKF